MTVELSLAGRRTLGSGWRHRVAAIPRSAGCGDCVGLRLLRPRRAWSLKLRSGDHDPLERAFAGWFVTRSVLYRLLQLRLVQALAVVRQHDQVPFPLHLVQSPQREAAVPEHGLDDPEHVATDFVVIPCIPAGIVMPSLLVTARPVPQPPRFTPAIARASSA